MTTMVTDTSAGLAAECSPPLRTGATARSARGYASGKQDYLRRLRKIEGQVRGLQKMIDADAWCPDVVTQVASATRALQERWPSGCSTITCGTASGMPRADQGPRATRSSTR